MARKINSRNRKPYIIIFWEGESEQVYMKYMRKKFHMSANLTVHRVKGVFHTAQKAFNKKGIYFDVKSEVDEIWLVFDTEDELKGKWNEYYSIIKKLRKLNSQIKVRLLMTRGCIEYYFLLHYEKCAPAIHIPADKDKVIELLKKQCPKYKKGDKESTDKIAELYKNAIDNCHWRMEKLREELSSIEQCDDRAYQLFVSDLTFSTVFEGIEYLEYLENTKV